MSCAAAYSAQSAHRSYVEPHVRIIAGGELRSLAQPLRLVLANSVGHGDRRFAMAELFEHFGQPTFQMQAVIEDRRRAFQQANIAGRRFIQVRVDAWPHEGMDFDEVAADVPEHVPDLAGRTNNTHPTVPCAEVGEPVTPGCEERDGRDADG